jgi:hypothetical protein
MHLAKPKPTALARTFDVDAAKVRAVNLVQRANDSARTAVDCAVAAGAYLIEIREGLKLAGPKWNDPTKPEGLKFNVVIEDIAAQTGSDPRNIYRWITCAENACEHLASAIDIQTIDCPVSYLLTAPEAEVGIVGSDAVKARQLLFDWMAEKSTLGAMRGVVVDGDPGHRVTRARLGKATGGTHADDDRKDYPKFIARHLSDSAAHLEKWDTFSAGQKDATLTAFANWLEQLDTALIEHLVKAAREEMKTR